MSAPLAALGKGSIMEMEAELFLVNGILSLSAQLMHEGNIHTLVDEQNGIYFYCFI